MYSTIAIIFSSELERRDRAGRSGASGDDMSPSGALPGPGRTERLPAVPPEPTNEDAQVFYTGTGSQGRCGHVSRFGADGPERAPGVGTVGLPASAMPARSLQLLLTLLAAAACVNVLVVYTDDLHGQNEQLAKALGSGVLEANDVDVRVLEVKSAEYKRDVVEWADAIALGSSVDNGNAKPELLSFINSFDLLDESSSHKPACSFATGGSAAAGLQPVLEQINRALLTFRFVISGGDSWQSGEGTGAVTDGSLPVANASLALARGQGRRLAWLASVMRSAQPSASSPPPPPEKRHGPPGWGARWSAKISANLTQVGYDAGLVIVNFSTSCCDAPSKQRSRTVYGDFYTVLTRCDLGKEFTVAPASRGGGCTSRQVGRDVDKRVCEACGCPFCVRDTNGTYTHGTSGASVTKWDPPKRAKLAGETFDLWHGTAVAATGTASYALTTDLAFRLDGTPALVNVSHPLWVQTAARVEGFVPHAPDSAFAIPSSCTHLL